MMNRKEQRERSRGQWSMRAALKLVLFIIFGFLVPSGSADVELAEESVITDEGLFFWYPKGEKAFHYAPSISPRGDCFTVVNGYVFFGWYKGGMDQRDLMISRKKIGSGKWETVQLPHKNTLIGPGSRWGESHNTITVAVSSKDATIHIFYDHHNDPLKYIVSKKGTAFLPEGKFKRSIFEPTRGYLAQGEPLRITYPKVQENAAGDLILNYRRGSAVGGNEMVHVYNGEVWTRATQVTRGSDQTVPESRKNYAYGSSVIADGNIYYAFSVRWRRKKEDGVLNEGVYLAKCGPTMTDDWEDPSGKKHKLPIEDYSPFLVADPKTHRNWGSSGGPSISISDEGDIALGFRGRGGSKEHYCYTRKAGQKKFSEARGSIKMGPFWDERMYALDKMGDGRLRVRSKALEDKDWKTELEVKTKVRFGHAVTQLVDGMLVMIVEGRGERASDRQNIHCFAFKVGDPKLVEPEKPLVKRVLTKRDDGAQIEVELVDVKRGKLICIAKGKQFSIPVSALTDADVEFLKAWIKNGKQ